MKVRKIAIAACFASALMMVSAPASAAAYLISGKWYYFSLDYAAEIGGVTGRDIKAGTNVYAGVEISMADVLCANPQGHSIRPGVGPQGSAFTTTGNITESDLSRKLDRVQGKTYAKTADVKDLVLEGVRFNPPKDLCKQANTDTYWLPIFWQDRNCKKGLSGLELNALANAGYAVCYRDLAIKVDNGLVYITGPNKDLSVGDEILAPGNANVKENWTFVYLPTAFSYTSKVLVDGAEVPKGTITGSCTFPKNFEDGANYYGELYSLRNPPVDGWAAAQPADGDGIDYFCPFPSYSP